MKTNPTDAELKAKGFTKKEIKLYRELPKYLIKNIRINMKKAREFGIKIPEGFDII